VILTHEGVYFVTANNIWPRTRRAQGAVGLEALFAERVVGRYDRVHERTETMAPDLTMTTCGQAEVLYPVALPTEHLRRIYVRTGEEQDDVYAQIASLGHRGCDVAIEPGMFGNDV
jgi:hypothetical protein